MQTYQIKTTPSPVIFPRLLLPGAGVDPAKWSVIACDQYTSEPEYWLRAAELVGDAASALKLILPECWLAAPDRAERIERIWMEMRRCLSEGILRETDPGLMLVERETPFTPRRRGVVAAVDLERYDYRPGTAAMIRPTEATIVERLPPRMEIRRGAALELPHILLLIDDPQDRLIGPLFDARTPDQRAYATELMFGAGRLQGAFVGQGAPTAGFSRELTRMWEERSSAAGGESAFLFAVGDGNHSLAAARAVWDELKLELPADRAGSHPARYALVELVNLYDPGVRFEPIHRLLTGIQPASFMLFLEQHGFKITAGRPPAPGGSAQSFGLSARGLEAAALPGREVHPTPAGTIQPLIDEFLRLERSAGIDYIHGRDSLARLAAEPGRLGLSMPAMDKNLLFSTVARHGILPRKAFSIGEASEKRFYFEARRL